MRKLAATLVRFSSAALMVTAGCAQVADEPIGVHEESLVEDAAVVASRDTYVRLTSANKNYGNETLLRVEGTNTARSLVQFPTSEITAATGGLPVEHAYLELTVAQVGGGWIFGQKVAFHRVKAANTEGGATWNCANDTIPANNLFNCANADKWKMSGSPAQLAYISTASATKKLKFGQTGKITVEVTADVNAFLAGTANHGWLIKAVNEIFPGTVTFRSSESSQKPRLILDLGTAPDGGMGCVPSAGNDVTCDGVDDDCNGTADEDFVSSATSCGVGACASTGATSCVGGAVVNSCVAGAPAPNDASCDGVDNDCNGTADEDFVPGSVSCGVGACAVTAPTSCVGGSVVSSCVPGAPAPNDASCDGVDNDCNGTADEDFVPSATSCGMGACAATGTNSCVGGSIVNSCTPGVPSPDTDCDTIDDDCDGTADDNYISVTTTCGVGACASTGSSICSAGFIISTCVPEPPAPNDATCNGIDNDCNGQTDEDYVSTSTTCGLNACASTGSLTCSGGNEVDSCTPVANCEGDCGNGLDDDGDTDVDCADFDCDGVPGCESDVGSTCDETADCASLGSEALCLTEDDNGVPGGYCTAACDGSPGSCPSGSECLGGLCLLPCGPGLTCDAGEACFEIEGPGACIPVCSTDDDCTGSNTCNTGTGFCEAPVCASNDATCDGIDDDCDSNIDEDFASGFGGDVSCGGDSCYEVGALVCVGGVVTDTCNPAPVCTQEFACGDASDNDGDGFADCFDPDCEQTPACLADASPVAGTCGADGDCRSVTGPAVCLAAPGGYCSNFCDEMDPSTCPDNATCSGGICLARCNPADGPAACVRPDHACTLEAGEYVCLPPA